MKSKDTSTTTNEVTKMEALDGGMFVDLIKAAFAFIMGGGVWASVIAFRKDRREAPKDTTATLDMLLEQAQKATSMAMSAMTKATESNSRADEAEIKAASAERRAIQAEARAAQSERTVAVFKSIIIRNIIHIIQWIDGGASPPPPAIQQELRDFVTDVDHPDERL